MHAPLLECATLGLQEGLNICMTGYKPKLQASHMRSDGNALTTAGMCQVGVAGVVEHGHDREHAQSCAAVGCFLVACGMRIGIHTGSKELQLLYAAWLIGACFGNCGLERLTSCTGKDCFLVLLAICNGADTWCCSAFIQAARDCSCCTLPGSYAPVLATAVWSA